MRRFAITSTTAVTAVVLLLLGIRELKPDRDSVAYHLNQMAYLKRTWPPIDPSIITEPIRTVRWYLQRRPSPADWGDRLERHQQILLARGYFTERIWQVTDRKCDGQWWRAFRDAMRAAGLTKKQFGMDFQSNFVFHIVACTSDIPTFDSVFRQLEKTPDDRRH